MTAEKKLEDDLIRKLVELKYSYRPDIRDVATLNQNFRVKFNELNQVTLTDDEFDRLLQDIISLDVYICSQHLRSRHSFVREDGTPLFYTLVNTQDWCKNTYEVINQLRVNTSTSHHRYDVILLINGVPVVQIELKTLGLSPRRAMQQIVDYKNDAGNGYGNTLLAFMQLFIVSNQKETLYFANNLPRHFSFNADEQFLPIYQWADEQNRKITELHAFADSFLTKCTLGQMISRYMVLVATEQKLMIMRPYQIYAVRAIVECIHQNRGNGYIWHTTGSGKTLTSFKASTLLKDNPDIDKCLFVVDRKDLDRQTREEFNKFQVNCVEENTNTATLVRRLLSTDFADKVIVTTIQKLGLALSEGTKRFGKERSYKEQLASLRDKRLAIIFDECHRSQFGDNHQAIKDFFPKSQLFGFTGTPIFEENASIQQVEGQEASLVTTEDIFQKQLHAYTITHAIEDRNVLGFHIDYYRATAADPKQKIQARAGDTVTQTKIVEAILSKHYAATNARKFNAVFATSSINDAIAYYNLFKTMQTERLANDPEYTALNIACVFSPPAQLIAKDGDQQSQKNAADIKQLGADLQQEKLDNQVNPEEKKQALIAIITDYNTQFGSAHSIGEFDSYYQDVQSRIKNQKYCNNDVPQAQKIDIVIVVDMLLTGFDSKFLNTLYVDKNLKYHGLIQAFSRTNRVLNDSKPSGNIIDFRGLEDAVDKAVERFSNLSKGENAKEIWLVESAAQVIVKLQKAKKTLDRFMQSKGLEPLPEQVVNLQGDNARAEFVSYFKEVQRLQTQLDQYTDLTEPQRETIAEIMPPDELRSFKGVYLETAKRLKSQQDQPNTPDSVVQELDFEFILFNSALIDYDYIMRLIAEYSNTAPEKQQMSREQLIDLIASDAKFIDDREDITAYINSLKLGEGLSEASIRAGYERFKAEQFDRDLDDIAAKYGLDIVSLNAFVEETLSRMILDSDRLSELMAPLDLGWKVRAKKEQELIKDLTEPMHRRAKGREISGWAAYV